ncbi:ABC transporter substrate-binding protein [Bacillus sp. SCS-153A]|uniref:ABC transporter substrate-binding protein n=1 Tax=Rossellomorea sedimentorum TaxID=3115294 RepID=UPI003905EFB4
MIQLAKSAIFWAAALLLVLAACGDPAASQPGQEALSMEWNELKEISRGTEVHMYMWGGDEGINRYIDEFAAPELKEKHDIELIRHPMNTEDFMSKLLTEKKANKSEGTIDIIWINGENFRNAKENDLLLGSFIDILPNYNRYVDKTLPYVSKDMGIPIDGMEAPWGKVQFVFHYDSDKVDAPPTTFEELAEWIHSNPGQFTYPAANDFTGNAFVRHLIYEFATELDSLSDIDEFDYQEEIWSYLNEIKPDLWRKGETYPGSLSELDRLYSQGEVAFTMGFNEGRVASLIEDGTFPDTTKSLVIEPGSIGNAHYLSIPFNSPNASGALAAINFFMSPQAQIAKANPALWGEGTIIDLEKLSEQQVKNLKDFTGTSVVKPQDVLQELHTDYTDWIRESWEDEVLR